MCWRARSSRSARSPAPRNARSGRAITRRWWPRSRSCGCYRPATKEKAGFVRRLFRYRDDSLLLEDHQYDATIGGAADASPVRLDRERIAVGDRRHPIERELLLTRQITAHRFRAPLSEVFVVRLGSGVVRVSLDLDEVLVGQTLHARSELVERGLRVRR